MITPQTSITEINSPDATTERDRLQREINALLEATEQLRSGSGGLRGRSRKEVEAALTLAQTQIDAARSGEMTADEAKLKSRRKSIRRIRKALSGLSQKVALEIITHKRIPRRSVFIGVDLGGTNAQIAGITTTGELLASAKVAVAGMGEPELLIKRIADETRSMLRDAGVAWSRVQSVGIGAAGTIDFQRGVVIFAPNLNWRNVPVESLLQEQLGIPVFLDNDVNVGTLGEWALGAGRGLQSIVGIFWGTGIGGGLILNGDLFRGANGMAAEVGHIVVQPDGPKCGCGNRGCMEAIAGRRSITRDIRAAIRRGETTVITTLVGRDLKIIRSGALSEAVKQKDPVTINVLHNAAKAVGLGIANIANMIDPDAFIVGGGVVEALGDWIVAFAEKAARKDLICADQRKLIVIPARLGDNGGALGAAIMAMQKWNRSE